jgi:hypothetical protein
MARLRQLYDIYAKFLRASARFLTLLILIIIIMARRLGHCFAPSFLGFILIYLFMT